MKKYLIKIKNLTSFKKTNPHKHWMGLLYFFFTMIIILVLFSFYLLYKVKKQEVFQVAPSTIEPPALINEKLLKKVNESFNNKLLKEKEIKEKLDLYKDPSFR